MAAGHKRDTQYVEALLSKRIEYVKKLKADLSTSSCTTAQTIAAYSDLLEGDLKQRLPDYGTTLLSMQTSIWP